MRMVELTDNISSNSILINLDLVTCIFPNKDYTILFFEGNDKVEVKEDYETIKKLIKEN